MSDRDASPVAASFSLFGFLALLWTIASAVAGENVIEVHFDKDRRARSAAIADMASALSSKSSDLAADPRALEILDLLRAECSAQRSRNDWRREAEDCRAIRPQAEKIVEAAGRRVRAAKFAEVAGAGLVAPLLEGESR